MQHKPKVAITFEQAKKLVVALLFCFFLLLPARFYTSMSLVRDVHSTLVVNYLNGVDLVALVLCFSFLILGRGMAPTRSSLLVLLSFFVIGAVNIVGLFLSNQIQFATEILSKGLMLTTAVLAADYFKRKLEPEQLEQVFLIPLLVLVIAAFFLQKYGSYGATNRGGTIGFGSNETAMFACMLIGMAFTIALSPVIRVGLIALAMLCVLTVSSRRGLIVGVTLLAFGCLVRVIRRKQNPKRKVVLFGCLSVLALLLFGTVFFDQIATTVARTPLVTRILYTERTGGDFFDLSNRFTILTDCLEDLSARPFLGFFGCDKVYAQGTNTHAHNLLLQMLVTYGCPVGTLINVYLVISFYRAIRLLLARIKGKQGGGGVSAVVFYSIYFVFDMFGYLLWNPKGLVWVVTSALLVNAEYDVAIKKKCPADQKRKMNGLKNGK